MFMELIMKNTYKKTNWAVALTCTALITLNGCSGSKETGTQGRGGTETVPSFSLAWSEYPSWSVFGVADANGIINVSATDKATGKEQRIRIEASSGLSDEEIQRMKVEAAANADADTTWRRQSKPLRLYSPRRRFKACRNGSAVTSPPVICRACSSAVLVCCSSLR